MVVTVEPSAVILLCQSVKFKALSEAPSDIASPPIVIVEFANLSLAIEPASFAAVIVPGAKSLSIY